MNKNKLYLTIAITFFGISTILLTYKIKLWALISFIIGLILLFKPDKAGKK